MPENTPENTPIAPLTKEEQEALTNDLNAVLEKHNAEISITSQLHLTRSQIPTPYTPKETTQEEDKK